jgi:Zn-dependent metalloprotease
MSLAPKLLSLAVLMALGGTAAAGTTRSAAIDRAEGLARANAGALHASAQDRFLSRDVIVDADGTEHVRFDRTYAGLPVIGGDVVVHSRGGQFRSASLTQRGELRLSTRPSQSHDDAVVNAGAEFGSDFRGTPSASLVVYARGATPALAWQVSMQGADRDGNDRDMTYIVDAKSGKVLDRWSNLETSAAQGTFKTLYSGTVTGASATTNSISGGYELRDPSRGNGWTVNAAGKGRSANVIFTDADNSWGNGSMSDTASAATDAQYGVGKTWDYYKNVHGRNGIANNGVGAQNRVHYGRGYVNAYWSDGCFCMTYGDGDGRTYGPLVNLDVAGHEMSHGVTSRSANLTYSGESGGLNEATSDIFGTMVEFYANNAADAGDYLIGEKIYISNAGNTKALRFMFSPNSDGGYSADCWYSGVGSLDVHYSSGVANHFFYLLAEGSGSKLFPGSTKDHKSPTCNVGDTKKATGSAVLAGIGRDAAQAIWYRALTVYMTSSTNYAGARAATLAAAADLDGGANVAAVAAAWSAVGVNCPSGTAETQTARASGPFLFAVAMRRLSGDGHPRRARACAAARTRSRPALPGSRRRNPGSCRPSDG